LLIIFLYLYLFILDFFSLQRTAARNLEDVKNDLFEIKKRLNNSPSAVSIETENHADWQSYSHWCHQSRKMHW